MLDFVSTRQPMGSDTALGDISVFYLRQQPEGTFMDSTKIPGF